MAALFDLHVATDAGGDSTQLRSELASLGFHDDKLIERGLTFPKGAAALYSACPLIDVHMSMKLGRQSRRLEEQVVGLMRDSGCSGYWHSEKTMWDAVITPAIPFTLLPPPFKPLSLERREQNKRWDLHVSFLNEEMTSELRACLIEAGLYYLLRQKPCGVAAVLTVQGVNLVSEGFEFSRRLLWWLVQMGAPRFDFKFEVTVGMGKVNEPQLVPPTIAEVVWR